MLFRGGLRLDGRCDIAEARLSRNERLCCIIGSSDDPVSSQNCKDSATSVFCDFCGLNFLAYMIDKCT